MIGISPFGQEMTLSCTHKMNPPRKEDGDKYLNTCTKVQLGVEALVPSVGPRVRQFVSFPKASPLDRSS